jgi:hypothetical protein
MSNEQEYNLLIELKNHKPYLYKLEQEIQKVINETGFGQVDCNFTIKDKRVYLSEFYGSVKELYPNNLIDK